MTCSDTNLIWLDLEMTGLEPTVDVIIEIASIITHARIAVYWAPPSITKPVPTR